MGTIQNKKQRGKSARLRARVPKEKTKAPIHQMTSASMFRESRSSGRSEIAPNLAVMNVKAAATNKLEPIPKLDFVAGSGDFQSMKIKATLTGRISRRCVY